MKRLTGSTAAKTTAFFLFFLSLITMILSAAGVVLLIQNDAYFDSGRYMRNKALDSGVSYYESRLYTYVDSLMFDGYLFDEQGFNDLYNEENCNYFFTIYNENGEIVLSNYTADKACRVYELREFSNSYYYDSYEYYGEIYYSGYDEYCVYLHAGIREELSAKDRIYYYSTYTDLLINNRYLLVAAVPILLIFDLVLLIFLVCAAGHHRGEDGVRLNRLDRIPFDVYGGLLCLLGFGAVVVANDLFWAEDVLFVLTSIATLIPIGLALLLTTATRIKTGTLFTNTLIYRLLRACIKLGRYLVKGLLMLPLYWKGGLIWTAWSAVELVVILVTDSFFYLPFWLLAKLVITPLLIWVIVNLQTLRKAGQELASGNIGYAVNTAHMLPSLKEHGEHLNGIGQGLQIAVEKNTRSERMRAELITNVSHDIKTPLTSIINYIDLLKKEGLDGCRAEEYVSVLERQSARLKKLVEDLIDASKASTGNMKVNITPLDCHILLQQATAEYEERMAQRELTVITRFEAEPACIHADGQLLWRVFDNLLSNIIKYAKNGTRVYLSTTCVNERVIIIFKNISGDPLDISGDELTERFVRGDRSRHTEGSGLGLSIAKSLTELQNGTFAIQIDGDLFKTIITFERSAASHE